MRLVATPGENAAPGRGLTERTANELFEAGVDVITSGNHIFDIREFVPMLDRDWPVLRPANYPTEVPGRGVFKHRDLTVISLMGRVFMPAPIDDPFRVADELLEEIAPGTCVVVDFHAEATSEKKVMGYHLAGRCSALLGTHTHVQTADETILSGTGYITDVGMTGVQNSSIGMNFEEVHFRFTTGLPKRYRPADQPGEVRAVALVLEGGKTKSIRRVRWGPDGKD